MRTTSGWIARPTRIPKDDVISNVLAVPVNREIHLLMHARDVGHSFYVRELRMQQDFVPGLDLSIDFTATTPGRYEIVCNSSSAGWDTTT